MPDSPAIPKPRRRWRRLGAALAAIAVVAAALLVSGPPVLGLVVAKALGPIVGGEVSIRSVHPSEWGGRWTVERLVVRAPGWSGPAGEVIEIDRAVAIVDRAAPGLAPEDLLASVAAAVGASIGAAIAASGAADAVLAGGGTRHGPLVASIARAAGVPVAMSDAAGIPSAHREAIGWAVLGALAQDGVPASLAGVTGRSEHPGIRAGAWICAGIIPA